MRLIQLLAIVSAAWGVINLLQVVIGEWDSPAWWRTLYAIATIFFGLGALVAVGINDGWFSFAAGFGLLNHLSAALVYTVWCVRTRASSADLPL